MLESIRRLIVLPHAAIEGVAVAATLAAFFWMLGHGLIQPVAIYLLELYLAF